MIWVGTDDGRSFKHDFGSESIDAIKSIMEADSPIAVTNDFSTFPHKCEVASLETSHDTPKELIVTASMKSSHYYTFYCPNDTFEDFISATLAAQAAKTWMKISDSFILNPSRLASVSCSKGELPPTPPPPPPTQYDIQDTLGDAEGIQDTLGTADGIQDYLS
jgi:hypothetical protein